VAVTLLLFLGSLWDYELRIPRTELSNKESKSMFEIAGGILIALAVIYIGLPLLGVALLEYKATLRFIGLIALAFSLMFLAPVLVQSPNFRHLFVLVLAFVSFGMSVAALKKKYWEGAAFFGVAFILIIFGTYISLGNSA
jgi:hypothetical protein